MGIFRKKKRKSRTSKAVSGALDGITDIQCCCIVDEVFDGVGDCFVATAANNDNLVAPQVTTLRAYRDQRLARHAVGRKFTELYYQYGRYGARFLRRYPLLKPVVRAALRPVAAYAQRRLGRG
jgi:hypothetical protein